jgi:hypothetical protein
VVYILTFISLFTKQYVKEVIEVIDVDRALNMRVGINYCISTGRIGFRGVSEPGWMRLIPLSNADGEIFFFHGVDVPADQLPYLPNMDEGSDFVKEGYWHHYPIIWGIFMVYLTPTTYEGRSTFTKEWVLQAAWFKGEECPRVFLDNREKLISGGIVDGHEIQEILTRKSIVMN